MKALETERKLWNQRQNAFRDVLLRFDQPERALDLFLHQHEALHAAALTSPATFSFADELLHGLSEAQFRSLPHPGEHSIAWCMWHTTRIEDVAMNRLVAGCPEVWAEESWGERLGITVGDTGNGMAPPDVAQLSERMNAAALWAYRQAVGQRTRELIPQLPPSIWSQKVNPTHLQQLVAEKVVRDPELIAYWSKRNKAELLLMPATRHNFVHLNEAFRLKQKR